MRDDSTLGQRLRLVIGAKKFTQQRVADATGLNRVTISLLLNDKVENPQPGTIQKLAEFLECSPIWLETGLGDMFEVGDVRSEHNIPTAKRLGHLKGGMTLKAFAKKCGVDEVVLAGYLEDGRIRDNEHVYKIAKAFDASLGWLTSGEAWQGPDKKYTGFSQEKHKDLGERLYAISRFMHNLVLELEFSYPLTGKLSRPLKTASECMNGIDTLRHQLEENCYEDNPDSFDPKIYYCGGRLTDENKFNDEINGLFDAIKRWQIDEYGADSLTSTRFLQLFHERIPEFSEWIKKQKGSDVENSPQENFSAAGGES